MQTSIIQCIDSNNRQILSMSECERYQVLLLKNRTCQIPSCLEWRVAQWHGVSLSIQIEVMIITKIFLVVFSKMWYGY